MHELPEQHTADLAATNPLHCNRSHQPDLAHPTPAQLWCEFLVQIQQKAGTF